MFNCSNIYFTRETDFEHRYGVIVNLTNHSNLNLLKFNFFYSFYINDSQKCAMSDPIDPQIRILSYQHRKKIRFQLTIFLAHAKTLKNSGNRIFKHKFGRRQLGA